ncbi:DUF4149 domain-containing protein [Nodularia spumigena CS-584]|jgi:hypothetical protein|uniref:Uncharacterized protein n=2 Tax=Nodularia spumigena TaxID=70799 RepID=A0A161XJ00_NODSP|nr:DUF4149 domain-containing protein [Nodularia spumigena]AHJ29578.1 hypothetical protein NSP_32530 [Nodularia spumigena CCY9414]EAW44336.1 hypothetical protein N9414_09326 [Nodularia spumigena CCY9414]KZL48424.1 hypothetical protein A2T98_18035 [Nodularia spumigena CENA596]MDB9343335.1 DUF4149 domain-containing protein [Nodularia spumigena CS-588/06]MDB9368885.1 DUF4149 domain-containing protein [Nodularia spumigena CS-586/05]
MNTISTVEFKRPTWQTAIMLALGFWLSASLVLDWVIMPSLYLSGMMSQTDFTTAGYVIFWNFNRLELLSAAVVLTGVLALSKTKSSWNPQVILFAVMLLAITLLDTFFLTPQMCAVGTHLNLFEIASAIPAPMNLLHGSYFVLEAVKLLAGGTLLSWCWRQQV